MKWISVAVFFLYLLHGALLGLTDDEAYYWVLAQRPALGYAFHPPAVAWSIAFAQWFLGGVFGTNSAALVRLPAAFYAAGVVQLALYWFKSAGVTSKNLWRGVAVLLSFVGFFGAAWMTVPDLPLLFGWMLAFVAVWELCFKEARTGWYFVLGAGILFALLSKYSGVLAVASCLIAFLVWARPEVRWKGWVSVIGASMIASIPVLLWNSEHEWSSLLFQVQGRHGDFSFSLVRSLRFWVVQGLCAGPPLVGYFFFLWRRVWFGFDLELSRVSAFVLVWTLPSAVIFCIQPAFSDFKLHWAFVVWLPIALEMGWAWGKGFYSRWAKVQLIYGLIFFVAFMSSFHFPWISFVLEKFSKQPLDPRLDVTNDLYGWGKLKKFLEANSLHDLPVVGSRYQTAAQAAFALGSTHPVTLIPRDLKQRDEWPSLGITRGEGPEWPELIAPVLFVGDNRYNAPPEFKKASCDRVGHVEEKRLHFTAKRIDVWKCVPER